MHQNRTLYFGEVHSTYALFRLGGTSSLSGKRVSDDITLNLHTDVCSSIPTHPVGDPPAYKYLAHRADLFPLETFTARSPPPPAFIAPTNKAASVEDVARLSLSPAGRVAKHCTPSLTNAGVPSATSLVCTPA
ncbi:hypothetical protein L210DRAFT_3544543 [Boletus edulis BED1]|uniref:Uncharacterized protein n=1 Tax=Boletus edulis BED1 TaxID=1328754 RepID=A0AAD4BS69_BOLED|nr:hypothetical protein L210DRAFT_3544543 [Boletus edulis BED1]